MKALLGLGAQARGQTALVYGIAVALASASCGEGAKPDATATSAVTASPATTSATTAQATVTTATASPIDTASAAVAASAQASVTDAPPTAAPGGGATNAPAPPAASASAATAATTTPSASAASAAAPSAPEVKGAESKGASFSAHLSGAGTYKAGQPGAVTAVVSALGGYQVNQQYPYKFKLGAPPAGVSYPEPVARNVARTEKRATIPIAFVPSQPGTVTIAGECSQSVCDEANCVVEKVPLSVTVKVE